MRIVPTRLDGVFVIELEPIADERGFFARAWCAETFASCGLEDTFVQANMSANRFAGTVRGMHYQEAPHAEVKLVRCVRGAVYDVAVDVRPESPTFLEGVGMALSAENRRALYVGKGFAHGFQTLEDSSELFYMSSHAYCRDAERGVRFDDPSVRIEWPLDPTVVSDKDRRWPLLDHVH